MPDASAMQSLTFPAMSYGKNETPLDMQIFLFRGASKGKKKLVLKLIAAKAFGEMLVERIELIEQLHAQLNGHFLSGGSEDSLRTRFWAFRIFFTWLDEQELPATISTIERAFLLWTDYLVHAYSVLRKMEQNSAYFRAAVVSKEIDRLLERSKPLISSSRLRVQTKRKSACGVEAEKQNLEHTRKFGSMLHDICDALSIKEALQSPLPLTIRLGSGELIEEWAGFPHRNLMPAGYSAGQSLESHDVAPKVRKRFEYWQTDGTLATRYSVCNLRIEAELLIFVAQTGMNFSAVHRLQLKNFFYVSHLDGYQVMDRKERRGGEVLFEIFKIYRQHLERYLEWRRTIFPNCSLLFPLVRLGRTEKRAPQFRLRSICKDVSIKFVPPQHLRNTRINWILRRTGDPALTADIAQHHKRMTLEVYELPSLQRTIVEAARFWSENDPAISKTPAAGTGECNGRPLADGPLPKGVEPPDCRRASGCLWCFNHRDIDSQDHVWSLASFRHLKTIELSRAPLQPLEKLQLYPELAINRLTDKLRWFRESSSERAKWVSEAETRIEEGSYHPSWKATILSVEEAS